MTRRSIKKAEKIFETMEALFPGAFEESASIWTCAGVLILSGFAFTNYAPARKNRGIIVLRNMGPVSERRLCLWNSF